MTTEEKSYLVSESFLKQIIDDLAPYSFTAVCDDDICEDFNNDEIIDIINKAKIALGTPIKKSDD